MTRPQTGPVRPDTGGASRRAHERAAVRVPLRLWLAEGTPSVAGEALNVSRGGMLLPMPKPLPVGTRLHVELAAGGGAAGLRALVEVVRHQWTAPVGVGVRFVEASAQAQELIDRLVADRQALDDYRVDALLGRGGMAEVYRAQALRGPWAGSTVALKRVAPALLRTPEIVELFRRECELGSHLKHPNIVEVYEVRAEGEMCFVTMELVDGHDLRQVLQACRDKDVRLPIDFACFVAHTVAKALDFAHRAVDSQGVPYGLVHRDVSPANVFISRAGEIKLGDFGVAHLANVQGGAQIELAGKEPYAAPDQLRGEAPSPAVDVFSLAAVLYELLTNHRAFDAPDVKGIRKKIAAGEVPPPSSLRADVPPALDALVLRGLAPYAEGAPTPLWQRLRGPGIKRFASAETFAAALRPCFSDSVGNDLAIGALMRHLFGDNG